MMLRQIASPPAAAASLGAVLVLGTAVGQAGHADGSLDFDPMGGMDMSGMSAPGSAAPPMPGMAEGVTGEPDSGAGPSAMEGMDMDMDDPTMAASMPGGFHASCTAGRCTVIFAATATGTAKILGTSARLMQVRSRRVTVLIGGRSIVLRLRHAVRVGRYRTELTKVDANEITVVFSHD